MAAAHPDQAGSATAAFFDSPELVALLASYLLVDRVDLLNLGARQLDFLAANPFVLPHIRYLRIRDPFTEARWPDSFKRSVANPPFRGDKLDAGWKQVGLLLRLIHDARPAHARPPFIDINIFLPDAWQLLEVFAPCPALFERVVAFRLFVAEQLRMKAKAASRWKANWSSVSDFLRKAGAAAQKSGGTGLISFLYGDYQVFCNDGGYYRPAIPAQFWLDLKDVVAPNLRDLSLDLTAQDCARRLSFARINTIFDSLRCPALEHLYLRLCVDAEQDEELNEDDDGPISFDEPTDDLEEELNEDEDFDEGEGEDEDLDEGEGGDEGNEQDAAEDEHQDDGEDDSTQSSQSLEQLEFFLDHLPELRSLTLSGSFVPSLRQNFPKLQRYGFQNDVPRDAERKRNFLLRHPVAAQVAVVYGYSTRPVTELIAAPAASADQDVAAEAYVPDDWDDVQLRMGRITVLESSLSALNLRARSWLTYDPVTAQNVTCLRMSLSSASDMGREWSDHQAQNTVELPRLVKEFMPNLVELVLHYTYYDVSEDPNNGKGLPLHDFGESILRWILTRLSSAPNLRVLTLTNAFGLDGLDPHKDLLVGFDDFPPALEYIAASAGPQARTIAARTAALAHPDYARRRLGLPSRGA
ncbi:hypothetical protein OC844_004329 [Tilletia horrida]|nr:hypothetical protein OC844_004329 [Tilletia horrida]